MAESIHVTTAEGTDYLITMRVAQMMGTLKSMMEDDMVTSRAGEDAIIPLPNVTGKVFAKLVEFCEQHKDDVDPPVDGGKPVLPGDKPPPLDTWTKEFGESMNTEELVEFLIAANYLDAKLALNTCARIMSDGVLGKTPKEIYEMYGVEGDGPTQEEDEQIRQEEPWLEDQ